MGITSKDIAAQRAMIERGEEKRQAAKQAEESERLRDTFAAAALTGLIASREWPIDSDEAAHYCYRVADAMLRERERTNHDAVPAARAAEPESSVPLGSGAALANTQTAPPCVETDDPPSQGKVVDLRGKVVQLRRVIDMMQARQFAVASAVREMTAVRAPPMESWECDDVI
jgi:hypothetical protein